MTQKESPAAPTFDALPLSEDVRRAVDTIGYTNPTPVQLAVYEPAVRGKNLVVQARTGTGKTASFGLPLVDQLVKRGTRAVQALVLTPTRELALQVSAELERLSQFKGLKIATLYGGAPMGKQIEALEQGAQIVVGTPGRVLDHLGRGTFDPSHVRILVLDEADEMLSMGFARELHAILDKLPKERQGLFFSATIPPDIERLATTQLRDPEFVTLSSDQVGALEVDHFVYMVPGDKRQALIRILEVENPESAIVFCNTRDETQRLADVLAAKGFDADWLNGDLDQREREAVMSRTREGKLRFLVATDVAARGIDISHLTHVINYDFPESAETYVHRTGRTGRAGRTGTAISLVGPKDVGNLYMLRLTYKVRPIEKHLPSAVEMKTRAEADLVAMFAESYGERPVHPEDLSLARRLLTHPDAEKIVAGLLREHLGERPEERQRAEQQAAEARRAKPPRPVTDGEARTPNPRGEARSERQSEERPRREGDRPRRGERPLVASLADWKPPAAPDDDKPLLDRPARRRDREAPQDLPPLPSFAVEGGPATAGPAAEEGEMVELFVNVGRTDGVRAADLQKLLTDRAGLAREATGRIRVRDRHSFIGVPKEAVERAIAALAGQTLGGRALSAEVARRSGGGQSRHADDA
jgi:ATP-dependent RNA helicase DeaD